MDWGLGHASRSVPLIRRMQAEGHQIILASSGRALAFWRDYFPELKVLEKPGYRIRYSRFLPLTAGLVLKSSSFFKTIRDENVWLELQNRHEHFDEVYSDNCYGLYHQKINCTIITHQLMIKCPPLFKWMEGSLHKKIIGWTNKFNRCWVPDYEGPNNLSGDLSHKYALPANATFIGPLSRFQGMKIPVASNEYGLCAIVSGPEPQRSEFEKYCIERIKATGKKGVLLRGLPEKSANMTQDLQLENIEVYNHLKDDLMLEKIMHSEQIICRSGYSTIMDLHVLGKKAIFIPTKGQTEQDYLWKKKEVGNL